MYTYSEFIFENLIIYCYIFFGNTNVNYHKNSLELYILQ